MDASLVVLWAVYWVALKVGQKVASKVVLLVDWKVALLVVV